MRTPDISSELIGRARGGDRAALGELLEHYRAYLRVIAERIIGMRLGNRLDASDIVQQTCLSAFGKIENFDAVDAGEPISGEEFMSRHADLREELSEFFEAADEIESLAGPTLLEYSRISSNADTSAVLDTLSPSTSRPIRQRPELEPGSDFGRYKIVEEIGRGDMGSVYLAFDNQLARNVALKIPIFDEQQEPEMIERFYREARVAATIRNPHICPVFDVDEIAGIHYITMAFIEGEPTPHAVLAKIADTRLARICAKLMQKQLDQRFPSMASVAGALEDYLRDQPPVIASPAAKLDKPDKQVKEPLMETCMPQILTACLLFVFLLVGAAGAVGYFALVKSRKAATAQKARPDKDGYRENSVPSPNLSSQEAEDQTVAKENVHPPNARTASLRYNWPAATKFGYSIKIQAAREKLKETLEGTLFYEIVESDKGDTRIRFDSRLSARNDSSYPSSAFTYERVSDSFPTFRDIVSQFPKHEFVVNRYGEVGEIGCKTQLPFALGCIGQFPIEAFGEEPVGRGKRTTDFNVEVFRTAPPIRYAPLSRSSEMVLLNLRSQMGLHVQDSAGKDVRIDATYQTDAADKGRYSAKGTGKIVFDKRRGLITRKTMSLIATDRGQAVELTVECCLLDDSELAERLERLEPEPDQITDQHQARIEALTGPIEIPTALAVTGSTVIKENDVLQAPRGAEWQDVKVLEVLANGQVKIHWIGFGSEYDEIVTRSRLRRPPTKN